MQLYYKHILRLKIRDLKSFNHAEMELKNTMLMEKELSYHATCCITYIA